MLEVDINISSEGEKHAVSLRKVEFFSSLSAQEAELTSSAKGHPDCDILVLRP